MNRHPAPSLGLRRLASLLALAVLALLSACAALPHDVQRPASEALTDVATTALARDAGLAIPDDKRHLSGLRLLPDGPEALATRVALARQAQKSLDVQYYLIAPDATGRQFLRELRDAAARGVRVRLLVDDLHVGELDELLIGLAAHERIEVRLFNPLPVRGGSFERRLLLSMHEFDRVNRRMHNKLFIADNSVAVTGGRNVANEYFMRSESANFIDMDLLSVGPAVRGLSDVFDRYWNSEQAFPLQALLGTPSSPQDARSRFDSWADAALSTPEAAADAARLDFADQSHYRFASVQVIADDPSKAAGALVSTAGPSATAMDSTLLMLRSAQSEVTMVSPYFVPGERGLKLMQTAIDKGIKISVMTNSLAATDEPLAYWGYMRYRAAMLRMGVSLSELSPVADRKFDMLGDFRSSFGALHAKVTVVDQRWLLVGSMNMDGRSARSNTEVGLLIDNPELASEAMALMRQHWSHSHYRLRLAGDGGGGVEWIAPDGDDSAVHRAEPYVSWLKRLRLSVMSLFVSEDLL
jgi:putative cardiolipin synthase